jgi:hypothetical protein
MFEPAKADILLEIDKLYKELYGRCCPNLFSVGRTHHMSDLQGLKVVLLAKLSGVMQ